MFFQSNSDIELTLQEKAREDLKTKALHAQLDSILTTLTEQGKDPRTLKSIPSDKQARVELIQKGMRIVLRLMHWGQYSPTKNYDLGKEAKHALDGTGHSISFEEREHYQFNQACNALKDTGGVVLLDHPDTNKIFVDAASVFRVLPQEILDRMIIITYDFQYPMNSAIFERDGKTRFIPAQATRGYVNFLKEIESYVKEGGIVFLMPKGTQSEPGEIEGYQGTFRYITKRWDSTIAVVRFDIKHSKAHSYIGFAKDRIAHIAKLWGMLGNNSVTTITTKKGNLGEYNEQ